MATYERRYYSQRYCRASWLRHEALAGTFTLVLLVIATGAAAHVW